MLQALCRFGSSNPLNRPPLRGCPTGPDRAPPWDEAQYEHEFRRARVWRIRKGDYDGELMWLLKNIRCSIDPVRDECEMETEVPEEENPLVIP